MSTKLRPEDLTSEERAIVDNAALFYRRVTGDVGETAEWAYVEALKEAEPIILARRALFAPAPENVAKVELGKVRELVNDLKMALSEAAPSEMTMLDSHEWRSDLAAVFAELDAAEGKRRE